MVSATSEKFIEFPWGNFEKVEEYLDSLDYKLKWENEDETEIFYRFHGLPPYHDVTIRKKDSKTGIIETIMALEINNLKKICGGAIIGE